MDLEALKRRIGVLPVGNPPPPWQRSLAIKVGGLRAVGFDRDSDLLLVVSLQGRGVIDCEKAERVARDDEPYFEGERVLEAEGIGPLAGRVVRVAGLFGGGLPLRTQDDWSIEVVALSWPVHDVLIVEPGSWLYGDLHGEPARFRKIASESELRACGFSYSGKFLVIATSSHVLIYGR